MSNKPSIAWVGGISFMAHMWETGFEPIHIGQSTPCPLSWEDLVHEAGKEVDYVFYADRSFPPPFLNVESFPAITVFHAIDTHIHSWYPHYAQGFDLTLVSLKDHMPLFLNKRLDKAQVVWFPPMPMDQDKPDWTAEKEWDLLFVGKVDKDLTPVRYDFLNRVEKMFPGLEVRQGKYAQMFPKARLVLNIAERNDLNFRVFEALACGSCLLTPEIGNGQPELFQDKVHFFTYPPDDAGALVALAGDLLNRPEEMEKVARAGEAEVNSSHRMRNRAQTLAHALHDLPMARLRDQRLNRSRQILKQYTRLVYLHWAEVLKDHPHGRLYLKAATAAK